MNYSSEFINKLINDEIIFCDNISIKYSYPENITHLLYVIIPAFVLKYGIGNRRLIEDCFSNIPIMINDKQDNVYQAYYFSKPKYVNNDIVTTKGIVLQNYKNIGLMQLVDNLVHEFNHAINSLNNEVKIDKNILIRTGIVYNYFDKNNLSFIKKGEEVIIEEVINTKQTELIIEKIKAFSNFDITNTVVLNTLYAIYHAFDINYKSNSYLLESLVCKEILENKTFISTFETLRFDGQVDDLHHFFDNIVGYDGALVKLSKYLTKSLELQKQYSKTKLFKKHKFNQIIDINKQALEIVKKFNDNTIYK